MNLEDAPNILAKLYELTQLLDKLSNAVSEDIRQLNMRIDTLEEDIRNVRHIVDDTPDWMR